MSEQQIESLSEREFELLELLSEGLSNREIALQLGISPNTVKVHLRNIYAKMQVSSRTEATMVAVRMGWVDVGRPEEDEAAAAGLRDQEEFDERIETTATGPLAHIREPLPPLARWQRVYLVACALLVAAGLWLIWPRSAQQTGPFTDRPAQAANWDLGRHSYGEESRWQALAQMPTPRGRLAVVSLDGRIYAIAGEGASGVTGAVEFYMPDTDVWARGADKPTAVANVGAVTLGAKIYVPGGSLSDGQVSNGLEVYDPEAGEVGSWSSARPMPKGLFAYAIAAHEGKLYLFGGWDGESYLTESYCYDPVQDTWQALMPMQVPRAFAGAATIEDHIYVVGGYDGQNELSTCEVYDPGHDTWETCPSMNAPRGGVGVAVVGDTLYVIGGGWDSYLVENEYFSPAQGTWRTFPSPIIQEWRNLGVTSSETFLYAFGGWDGEFLAVNQAYRALYRLYMPGTIGKDGGTRP
jgi:DNA-binding CsgD family transcriptional regulator/N-acetylneuraminic acid mutarotase